MKFGQLIEYSMRSIFLEKSYTKCDGETIPKSFSKKSKLRIFNNVTYVTYLTISHICNNDFLKANRSVAASCCSAVFSCAFS